MQIDTELGGIQRPTKRIITTPRVGPVAFKRSSRQGLDSLAPKPAKVLRPKATTLVSPTERPAKVIKATRPAVDSQNLTENPLRVTKALRAPAPSVKPIRTPAPRLRTPHRHLPTTGGPREMAPHFEKFI